MLPRLSIALRRLPRLLGAAGLCAGAASAQYWAPQGPVYGVPQSTAFSQYWVRTAVTADGSKVGFSFNSGQEMYARFFDGSGSPLTGNVLCNTIYSAGVQDEGEIGVATDGRFLVAWSERSGADGEQMGIFGRIFTASGSPLTGGEFQINQAWMASQWRPLIASRPAGGWVVAWSGDWDGDPIFRLLDTSGTFLTGDIHVDTIGNGGQTDTAPAVAPDGTMFMVFVDYSGSGVGSGTNLFGRLFDEDGHPLMPAEYQLTLNTSPGTDFSSFDQREPRVAADGAGRFIVVWESAVDAAKSDWDVFARRFGPAGTPLGDPFQVNTNANGFQNQARVVADPDGNFIVTWTDWSGGTADIHGRRYDVQGPPVGPEFTVNPSLPGNQVRPSLAMDALGEKVVFCYEGPGNSTDAFAVNYLTYQPPINYCTAKLNSQGCMPQVVASGIPSTSGAAAFDVGAQSVLNNKNGILFYGLQTKALAFQGGTLCVQAPVKRTPLQDSGGNPPPDDCSGVYTYDFNARIQSGADPALQAGATVYCQYWSRDPASASGTGLTDGLCFEIRP